MNALIYVYHFNGAADEPVSLQVRDVFELNEYCYKRITSTESICEINAFSPNMRDRYVNIAKSPKQKISKKK
jgi:hypothetical protein